MVRTPCCKAEGLKKGAWTPEEDQKLIAYVQEHGEGGWRTLPEKAGLKRCGKSCRLRWANYLRPDIKRGDFSRQEEETIVKLHARKGNKWAAIASHLPGRTDNEIKNYWNTHIKKRLIQKGIDPITHKPIDSTGNKTEKIGSEPESQKPVASSGSARLLNRVATKLAVNVNRNLLAGIIHGDSGDGAQNSGKFGSPDANSSGNVASKLLNKMAAKPEILKSVLAAKYENENNLSASTSSSGFSDDFLESSMSEPDSTAAGGDDYSRPFDFDGVFSGDQISDYMNAENSEFMKELNEILHDDIGDNNILEKDSSDIISEEIPNYWEDDMDLDHFSLLHSSVRVMV